MERVRSAIEKARKSREQKETVTAMQAVSPDAGTQETEFLAKHLPRKRSPLEITYTHTPSIILEDKALLENRVIAGFQFDERAEVYRQLRSMLLPKIKSESIRTLAITSPNENAGKTLTAVNLAISISLEVNQTVLLVDLDLRDPSVCKTFGLNINRGLADCILNYEPIEDVLINPQYKRLVVLPGRALGAHSSELLTSPRMQDILDEIVNRYDSRLIIFDLPPLLRNDDALVFTPLVDATLMVIEDGATTAAQIKRCLHLLEKCNHIGTILNKARD